MSSAQKLQQRLREGWQWCCECLLAIITSPYYLLYQRSTKVPVEEILQATNLQTVQDGVVEWLGRKKREATYVQIAGAVIFASVTGAISWQGFHSRHWLCSACFYSCIVLAVASVVTGAQQTLLLEALSLRRPFKALEPDFWGSACRPNCNILFAWQMPLMFLNYSMLLFLIGLSAWVVSPVAEKVAWDEDAKTLTFYCAILGVTATIFVVCSRTIHYTVEFC